MCFVPLSEGTSPLFARQHHLLPLPYPMADTCNIYPTNTYVFLISFVFQHQQDCASEEARYSIQHSVYERFDWAEDVILHLEFWLVVKPILTRQ